MDFGSRRPEPLPGTVEVWWIELDQPPDLRARLVAQLDEDERQHAARMRVGGQRWAVARGARRVILAGALGLAADALRFDADAFGKPVLVGHPGVHFNTSAREGLALLALSSAGPVGVDVERDALPGDVREVARQFLPPREYEAIMAAPPGERAGRFAIAWTRFEAERKQQGFGIGGALVPESGTSPVHVREVPVPAGFVAAVAAEGEDWVVRMRNAAEVIGAS